MKEFIEKGRHGMGSTAILRILTGANVVDLKGISKIEGYNKQIDFKACFIILLLFIGLLFVFSNVNNSLYIQSYIKQLLELR
jgi:uncharacterized membrane-anchored protein